jgi:hypothetical protein
MPLVAIKRPAAASLTYLRHSEKKTVPQHPEMGTHFSLLTHRKKNPPVIYLMSWVEVSLHIQNRWVKKIHGITHLKFSTCYKKKIVLSNTNIHIL